jgi:Family of unknown function (DUF6134)
MLKMNYSLLLLLVSMPTIAQEWAFDVYLDKNKIGTHSFNFNNNTLTSRAKFNVKVLFINAYKYVHTAKEQWQGDCLASLDANTVENKVTTNVKGDNASGNFALSPARDAQFPNCVMTFAYWNPEMLKQKQLLNPQTGDYLNTDISKLGTETIKVKGKDVSAEHYKLTAPKMQIDLWYQDKQWVALKSVTPEGYNIYYKLK